MGALTFYLDASVLVSLFVTDAHNARGDVVLKKMKPTPVVSDFAAAEYSSAIAHRVRTGDLTIEEADEAFANFDARVARTAQWVETEPTDVTGCAGFLRRIDLKLRTPDALNIAIAQRIGAQLLTFDKRMASAATALGVDVVAG